MKTYQNYTIFTYFFLLIILISVILLVNNISIKYDNYLTNYKCCNNHPCSDTRYSYKDKQCHFTMCENNNLIWDKSVCVYNVME